MIVAERALADLVSDALRMNPDDALAEAFKATEATYRTSDGHEAHLAALAELKVWPERKGKGFVLDAFWSAWDAFREGTDFAAVVAA